eukprot:936843-Prymnesium_polylepis.1
MPGMWPALTPCGSLALTPTSLACRCIDWHPHHASVLALGLYDGTVAVYDVRDPQMKPLYQSSVKTFKHTDPVWEVAWQARPRARPLARPRVLPRDLV